MFEVASIDEMERLERTVQRVFARVSFLEARVHELERELALARSGQVAATAELAGVDRLQAVEALARTA